MVSINLSSLVKKLNPICLKALENAAGLCLSRTNYNVEFEHWLLRILEAQNTDAYAICRHFNVDVGRLIKDLTRSLDKFRTGNSRTPTFSQNVIDLAKDAWVVASLDYGAPKTRSGHLLIVFLGTDRFALQARETSAEFTKIQVETLRTQLRDITNKSDEEALDEQERNAAAPGAGGAPGTPGQPGKAKALDQFTEDLTAKAKAGKIDPILGRDSEIRQVIDILTRRRQNNPIMTGEAGVGKTAVVEGFAQRIAAGDVPPMLRNVSLRSLDLGLLQAGASVKGEFENRLKNVIEEVKSSPTPIILFIDEAHTLIGAGGAAGQNDAANLLKPALARGELRTIAATTWAEYKKYFEKDAALARRFQVVKVEEPEEKVAIQMMRGLVGTLEKHHKVRILDEAVVDSVRLSHRYISGRQLPDKSVSLLDTACARVSMSQHAKPGPVEDVERRITQLITAIEILERESAVGTDHVAQLIELREVKAAAEAELATINGQWEKEKALATKMRELREKLEGQPVGGGGSTALAAPAAPVAAAAATAPAAPGSAPAAPAPAAAPAAPKAPPPPPLTPEQRKAFQEELATLEDELDVVQGELPLISVCVGGTAVADVVSNWTGIPVGRMVSDEIQTVLKLKDKMEERIVGQPHALEAIAQRIRMSRANLTDPRRPIGVFLLVGTSGVGKTETAITLADLLYGGEQNMTVINMSEYKEEHRISQLIGSPKGYVGYGEGGVLTEAVRRRPYSVVLLDEMEKAHPGLQDMFYQVFDKGTLTDGEGREIDFKNTVILMTSNAGTDTIIKLWGDPDTMPDAEGLGKVLFPELMKTFKPAFLGRLSVVPYFPLGDAILKQIVELQLGKIRKRIFENYKAKMTYSPELVQTIAGRCTEVQTGARNVDHIISKSLLPELSAQFLAKLAAGESIATVHIGVKDDAFTYELT